MSVWTSAGTHPSRQGPLPALRRSRLWLALRALTLLMFFGAVGYFVLGRLHHAGFLEPRLLEPWGVLDCAYMTVITVSTIGYGETLPLPPEETLASFDVVRVYTILLIMTATILVAYSVSSATAFFVEGDPQKFLMRRRVMKRIANLKNHFVVCGCGVTGRVIADELLATGHEVVMVDDHPSNLESYQSVSDVLSLEGDATTDETLEAAGIGRAYGLAAALPQDKDNLFLLVTARQLNPELRIVSTASNKEAERKLERAGADSVVSSSYIGGLRLASELVRPAVVSFLDVMLRGRQSPVRFAQVEVGRRWAGKRLGDLNVQEATGLPVLALRSPGQSEFVYNPPVEQPLEQKTLLVTMGAVGRVEALERLVGDEDGADFLGGDRPSADPG